MLVKEAISVSRLEIVDFSSGSNCTRYKSSPVLVPSDADLPVFKERFVSRKYVGPQI